MAPMEQPTDDTLSRAMARLTQGAIATVSLQFTDLGGHIKGVSVPSSRFAEVARHGQRIDGSSLDSVVRLRESDMLLRPDLATLTIAPPGMASSEPGAAQAHVICDVCELNGQPFVGDPRAVLRRAIAVATTQGYSFHVAPEVEFYVCQRDHHGRLRPLNEDRESYFDLSADQGAQFREALALLLQGVGIGVESSHHEVGAGQHEIDLASADAMRIADALVTFKYLARQLARRQGVQITFMPNERWSWGVGYWYLRQGFDGFTQGSDYLTTTAFYRLDDNWGVRATENYNIQDSRLQQQFYTLYRDMRSWTAALTFNVQDNSTGPTDYTVAFTFSLKASPSSHVGDDTVDPYHLVGQ